MPEPRSQLDKSAPPVTEQPSTPEVNPYETIAAEWTEAGLINPLIEIKLQALSGGRSIVDVLAAVRDYAGMAGVRELELRLRTIKSTKSDVIDAEKIDTKNFITETGKAILHHEIAERVIDRLTVRCNNLLRDQQAAEEIIAASGLPYELKATEVGRTYRPIEQYTAVWNSDKSRSQITPKYNELIELRQFGYELRGVDEQVFTMIQHPGNFRRDYHTVIALLVDDPMVQATLQHIPGSETIEKMKARHAHLRTLIESGHANEFDRNFGGIVRKPYPVRTLFHEHNGVFYHTDRPYPEELAAGEALKQAVRGLLAEAKQFKQELEARVQNELTARQAEVARKQAEAEVAQQAHFLGLWEEYKQRLQPRLQTILDLQYKKSRKEQEVQKLSSQNAVLRFFNGANARIEALQTQITDMETSVGDIVRGLKIGWWSITPANAQSDGTLTFLENLPAFLLEGLARGQTTEQMVEAVLVRLEGRQ